MRATFKVAKFLTALLGLAMLAPLGSTRLAASPDALRKLDRVLQARTRHLNGYSRVIVRTPSATSVTGIGPLVRGAGGMTGRVLSTIASQVAVVPNASLRILAASPLVERVSLDRRVVGAMERTAMTVGAVAVRQNLGVDGTGVGVAVIDSGITSWHDDLSNVGVGQRVAEFVDFVDGVTTPHDDYGHGTHVAGIVAGNGFDSDGARTGIAPEAHLVVLKVLDDSGRGYVSDVIAAIDYAVARRDALNIRVVNLSVATGVYESYNTDPLTVAAERAVRAGITVVAAAGNNGRSPAGHPQYGGITSPGNAPWVLTVGASSHMGTLDRADDTIAAFTSRGPAALDHRAKPDLVAPGIGIESLSTPDSSLYATAAAYLLPGTRITPQLPYLSLSGTSMSAPVVSGTVALMLQVNPTLTPNAVKAILQYTAEVYAAYDHLTEGAGFLNAKGAIELARYLARPSTSEYPDSSRWGAAVIWGNLLVKGGRLSADANAWSTGVTWGAERSEDGQQISWGTRCSSETCATTTGKWRVDSALVRNVVWGSICNGADCDVSWSVELVGASDDGETVVWGTDDGETVVWGTDDGETVVWGTDGGETVVWGTACTDPSCVPIIWSRR
jgi:serine protease AprX